MGMKYTKSFTLIELIVAVGVVGLILPSVFTIFFAIIRQQLVLAAYQDMIRQGNAVQRNIINILQYRTAYVTNRDGISSEVCPVVVGTTPTPTYSSDMYLKDKQGYSIHLYQYVPLGTSSTIASASGDFATPFKTYYLSSPNVAIEGFQYNCYQISKFAPVIVEVKYTLKKSIALRDVTLPYEFKVRLREN